jgi:membrane protease subunit (stomatin/prohibitin family)
MAFLSREFIAVPDSAKRQILFKWPDMQIRKYSQLIVAPDELAVFLSKGQIVGTLGPGHHSLTATTELPGIGILQDLFTGGDAYRTELYFVGTRQYVDEKFGGPVDNVQDPASKLLVSLRVFGTYALQVIDPVRLILNLTGTVNVADNEEVTRWIDEQLMKSLRQFVTTQVVRNSWPVVSLSAYAPEIEEGVLAQTNAALESYGLMLPRLGNFMISLTDEDAERLKGLASDVVYSGMAGGYAEMGRIEALRNAGEGMAEGGAGAVAPLLMTGMGMGQAINQPAPAASAAPQMPAVGTQPQAAASTCSACQGELAAGVKFCPHCGVAQAAPAHCTQCGAQLAAGAKFCAECGTPRL